MKKMTFNLPSVDGVVREHQNDHIVALLRAAPVDVKTNILGTLKGMLQQGDVWFMHDALINDNQGFEMVIIFDSQAAIDTFDSTVKSDFEGFGGTIAVEDMTFEQFATYAANNAESTFDGQMV